MRQVLLVDAPTVLGWDEWRALDEESSARHLAEALTALASAGSSLTSPWNLWPGGGDGAGGADGTGHGACRRQ
ncbi:hypothetical protein ACFW5I_32940 [Streptomyces sp. NPDC058818]|uniref:hypothetical protein n=1 Tax=Streptomyces sp. NPDC058818 TaxID=3346640 RepID=UPI0036BD229A